MKFISPVDVTPASASSWEDIDVTSHVGSDAGSVAGVYLEIVNISTTEYDWGVRKKGSTDTLTRVIEDEGHTYVAIGVDSNDIFQANIGNTSNVNIYLLGYLLNDEATFFTNMVDVSIADGNVDSWTDVDISSHTGGDTSQLAFLIVDQGATNGNPRWGLRKNGSTDTNLPVTEAAFNDLRGAMIGVDENEIFEGYIDDTDTDFYLTGYMTSGVTTFTNAVEHTASSAGTYEDVDFSSDIPANDGIALFHFFKGGTTTESLGDIRQKGIAREVYYDYSLQQFGAINTNDDRLAEQKVEHTALQLFLMGYVTDSLVPSVNDSLTIEENTSQFEVDSGVHVFIGGTDDSDEYTDSLYPTTLSSSNILTRQVDRCRFSLKKYGSSHTFTPEAGSEAFVYIDGVREFGGIITRVTQRSEDYKIIRFDVECEDYTRLLDRKLIADTFEQKTLLSILTDLKDRYFSDFTLLQVDAPDTQIEYAGFNYEPASTVLTKIADKINHDWYVDYYKNIYFISKTSKTAPFTLFDSTDSYIFDTLRIRSDISQVRNSVFVAGGEYLADTFTTEYVSDGIQNVYPLAYKYQDLQVAVTGEVWDGGIDGNDPISTKDYIWNKKEKFIRFRGDRIPNDTSDIRISGQPFLPVRVQVRDSDSIDEFAALEGGDGVYEHIVVDDSINSQDGARERANAELEAYKNTLSEGSFITKKQGLRAGQEITINSSAHGINKKYLINSVRTYMRNNIEPRYEVSIVSMKTVGIIEVLQNLLLAGRQFTLGDEEIVDNVRSQDENISLAETFTAQPLNYDVIFVAGAFDVPSGTKRVFVTDGSPLGDDIHPLYAEELVVQESVSVVIS